jgi:hypothetical protein
VVSTGPAPTFLQPGVPTTVTLTALKAKNYVLAINPAIRSMAANHTISARITSSGATATDRVSFFVDRLNFANGNNVDLFVDGNQPSGATEFSWDINFFTKRNFLTVLYRPQNMATADIVAQTRTITVEFTYRDSIFQPSVLPPDTAVTGPALYVRIQLSRKHYFVCLVV